MFESKWMNDFHNFVGLWVRGIFRDNHDISTGNWLKSYHFAEVAWSGMVAMNNYLHPMIKGSFYVPVSGDISGLNWIISFRQQSTTK